MSAWTHTHTFAIFLRAQSEFYYYKRFEYLFANKTNSVPPLFLAYKRIDCGRSRDDDDDNQDGGDGGDDSDGDRTRRSCCSTYPCLMFPFLSSLIWHSLYGWKCRKVLLSFLVSSGVDQNLHPV